MGLAVEVRHARGLISQASDFHLEGVDLTRAHPEKARLGEAHLEGATLFEAHLEQAYLGYARLETLYVNTLPGRA